MGSLDYEVTPLLVTLAENDVQTALNRALEEINSLRLALEYLAELRRNV